MQAEEAPPVHSFYLNIFLNLNTLQDESGDDVDSMSVKELKTYIELHGLSHSGCIEKSELRQRAQEASKQSVKKKVTLHLLISQQILLIFSRNERNVSKIIC